MPSRSFDNKDHLEENHELLLTRVGHWVEHTSIAQRFQRLCFCLYLYPPELLSLNLYMTLLSFVMLLLNYVFSPIQQAHCILMSALASFMKKNLWKFTARVMFLAMCTILWRCKLKPPQNGNLKKPKIDVSSNSRSYVFLFATSIYDSTCIENLETNGNNTSILLS